MEMYRRKEYDDEVTPSQKKIIEVCDTIKDFILYKNKKYGDSVLNPKHIFYKGDSINSIKIRLDDSLENIMNHREIRVNDVFNIIECCILLLVSMCISKKEIDDLKDKIL